eukprot:14536479-Ditylum_brightwellii.AAC.1
MERWERTNEQCLLQLQENKQEGETKRRSMKIRLLFNGSKEDRETICSQLQEDLRRSNPECQVWLSRLQTVANPVRVGRIFYSAVAFDMKPMMTRILDALIAEMNLPIQVSIAMEAAFEDDSKRKK